MYIINIPHTWVVRAKQNVKKLVIVPMVVLDTTGRSGVHHAGTLPAHLLTSENLLLRLLTKKLVTSMVSKLNIVVYMSNREKFYISHSQYGIKKGVFNYHRFH